MQNLPAWLKYTATAGLSAVADIITFLTTVLTGNQTRADVTFVQWLICLPLFLYEVFYWNCSDYGWIYCWL